MKDNRAWSPFPRRDPLNNGPGSRLLSKEAWAKHGITEADKKVARTLFKRLDISDFDPNGIDVFDIAYVLARYRERYEEAAHARDVAEEALAEIVPESSIGQGSP